MVLTTNLIADRYAASRAATAPQAGSGLFRILQGRGEIRRRIAQHAAQTTARLRGSSGP